MIGKCNDMNLSGAFRCDLQPDHGGLMHSALFEGLLDTVRIWWADDSGLLMDYSRRAIDRVG